MRQQIFSEKNLSFFVNSAKQCKIIQQFSDQKQVIFSNILNLNNIKVRDFFNATCAEYLNKFFLSHEFIIFIYITLFKLNHFLFNLFFFFNQIIFNEYFFLFVLETNLSFYLIKYNIFCDLLHFCWSIVEILHWIKFKIILLQYFEKIKKKILYDFLSSYKILLALNYWTSSNKYAFLAISDYFISDNWDYHEILLIFKSLCDKHSKENLTNYVMKTLKFHDITNQLLTITTDNAKNNDKLCKHLQKMLKKNIVWNHQ